LGADEGGVLLDGFGTAATLGEIPASVQSALNLKISPPHDPKIYCHDFFAQTVFVRPLPLGLWA